MSDDPFYQRAEPVDRALVVRALYRILTNSVNPRLLTDDLVVYTQRRGHHDKRIDEYATLLRLFNEYPSLFNNGYYKIRDAFQTLWGLKSSQLSQQLFTSTDPMSLKHTLLTPDALIDGVLTVRTSLKVPKLGTTWKHENNLEYVVYDHTNEASIDPRYPLTVSLRNPYNSRRYSRVFNDWHKKYSPLAAVALKGPNQ